MTKLDTKYFTYLKNHSKIYFAYGSNLNRRQMKVRCPTAKFINTCYLKNYKLVFRGVADVEKCKGEKAWGALWKVGYRDIVNLDAYEGFPHMYGKEYMDTKYGKGFFYIMNNQYDIKPPSEYYYETIKDGYRQCKLPSLKPLTASLRGSKKSRNTDVVDCGAKWGINTRNQIVSVPSKDIIDMDFNQDKQPTLWNDLFPYGRKH